jgi:hypothetical protein
LNSNRLLLTLGFQTSYYGKNKREILYISGVAEVYMEEMFSSMFFAEERLSLIIVVLGFDEQEQQK